MTSGAHRLSAIKPHSRFLLDQATITWGDDVYCWWHPDDGYMLEQFTAADAHLVQMPPAGYSLPKPAAPNGEPAPEPQTL